MDGSKIVRGMAKRRALLVGWEDANLWFIEWFNSRHDDQNGRDRECRDR